MRSCSGYDANGGIRDNHNGADCKTDYEMGQKSRDELKQMRSTHAFDEFKFYLFNPSSGLSVMERFLGVLGSPQTPLMKPAYMLVLALYVYPNRSFSYT